MEQIRHLNLNQMNEVFFFEIQTIRFKKVMGIFQERRVKNINL